MNTFLNISFQGSLKYNIIYEQSQNKLIGYLILGFILISLLFGVIIVAEMFLFPSTMGPLNNALLISIGIGILFIIIYRNYFKKGKVS